jgi:hypothetical protein
VEFANVAIYGPDSSLAKVETTDEIGVFRISGVRPNTYRLVATSLGYTDMTHEGVVVKNGDQVDLGVLMMSVSAVELATALVSATRAMVEIKPDRTVFNVQGTINSAGDNALSLLRKAPGVLVDNNNNISVLSRPGVLIYLDGKRMPLSGDDLAAYLENLPAEQIDRIDIITNPGAKYEAEGNAGIIDIRLKKDTTIGAKGSLGVTYSEGQRARGNVNATGNYRNKLFNLFGGAGYNDGIFRNEMMFLSFQNGLELDEILEQERNAQNFNIRAGMDFFLDKKHTIGFLVNGFDGTSDGNWYNRIETVGVTAGASCPNNLIEDTIRRLFDLRGVSIQQALKN